MQRPSRFSLSHLAATVVAGLVATIAVAIPVPAQAAPDGSNVVINEVYVTGGSAGAPFNRKFVELYNPTDQPISLSGWSLQYRSATNGGTSPFSIVAALNGEIPANGHYLVAGGTNGTTGAELPEPDLLAAGINPGAGGGTLVLASTTAGLTIPPGEVAADAPGVVDLLGYGNSNTYETTAGPAPGATSNHRSIARTDGVDSDDNGADFVLADEVTPQKSGADPGDPGDPEVVSIAEIQGTGDTSPLVGRTVVTRGVVTATYPTGGFDGFYMQTPGTGGDIDPGAHVASHGIFVFGATAGIAIGDHVEVTGPVVEFFGMTEIAPSGGVPVEVTVLDEPAEAVKPATIALPTTAEGRERFEGMLVAPQGPFTVSDPYPANQYGEIVLAAGTEPLRIPTDVADPGSPAYHAVVADNAARRVVLDDGASINFLPSGTGGNKDIPLPYLSLSDPVRTGAPVTFTQPVILDWRNNAWKFQPTTHLTAENAAAVQPATFANTRTPAPEDVGGTVTLASFNVLNYFTTTGDQVDGCVFYTDREGNPITVNTGCDARGAADAANLARQEAKIVAAITALGADVIGLQEIENSAPFGKPRDQALSDLVDALNAAEGSDVWAYAPSPAETPEEEDVIRTAFIYRQSAVELVGESRILIGAPAFDNAREPLAQAFRPVGGSADSTFVVIVNHFKSKSSGGASGPDADQGDGQGAYNASRVAQAEALVAFADEVAGDIGTDLVFLTGDFNSYTHEDPVKVLEAAGYVDQVSTTGESTYVFGGEVGSLDHTFASAAADATVTGVDVWNINAGEALALEYSRFNYNITNFYDESVYRSSDHDPIIVGFDPDGSDDPLVDITLLGFNDFHGRIDTDTVKWAGTIEELRAGAGEGNTIVWSAGDNIGASVFASAIQQDQPTIDVLNALDLTVSTVGNHEFDQGFADLTDRVIPAAEWPYLGANVYHDGTTDPALPEYALFEIDGIDVGVIGAVTAETPSLVSPDGVAMLDFGDPVQAVNRVAAQLTDGDEANGEADVLVATFHEGSPVIESDGATLDDALAAGGPFVDMVESLSPEIDAILNGHTNGRYAFDAPLPEGAGTRPIMQAGEYGTAVGEIVLTVDRESGDVVEYTQRIVPRTTRSDDELVAAYPRVAEVADIVAAALEHADEVGSVVVGSATADITTAFSGGSYVGGVYTGGSRDDRASESTLGNLVADALLDTLAAPERGGAQIGVVNPGGLRNELFAGEITFAEANAVLPFVNNLWTTTLTGAQVTTMLEQQWQRDANGDIPSRPYLQLGLSSNVSYTYDPTLPEGSRITSIWLDGEPIDPDGEYRIGSFNFLLQGGDNFHVFRDGTDTRDSGLIDRDAWVSYIETNSPLSPNFARRAVAVEGAGQDVAQGETLTLAVAGLDLTSLGSPQNTTLAVTWEGSAATFADVPVTDGAATVSITVPDDVAGPSVVVLTASPSGTTVRVPVVVDEGSPTDPPAWSPSETYDTGDRVTYDGRVWEATWWTREVPGANPWGSWQEIATAPDGTAIWTPSRIFDTGDVALHEGRLFEASWWTRNQAPGDPWGPWQEIATAPDGTAIWTPSRIFDTGDVVLHEGATYRARWWNRNQPPGAGPWGPWEPVS